MEPAYFPRETVEAAPDPLPVHIGVIMDGNGRWAQARGQHRTEGHRAGVEALRRLLKAAVEFNIPYLTIYSFSSENWQRPRNEINTILGLMRKFATTDINTFVRHNVRVRILGARDDLNISIRRMIGDVERATAHCTGLQFNVAFNYGSRAELVHAVRQIAQRVSRGEISADDVDEDMISSSLYTANIPDPDVIFRSSGEQRLSNFLMWQAAYTEFVFSDEFWPEFDRTSFLELLSAFAARKRRFGGIAEL